MSRGERFGGSDASKAIFKAVMIVVGVIILGVLGWAAGNLFETVDADEIVVMQDPVDGELHFWTTAGMKWQNFGRTTHYKKSFQYWFSKSPDQGKEADQSIKIRFNDGGHANISGSIRADLPIDTKALTEIHTKLGSQYAVEHELLRPVIEKSVYMTGPMMTSKESYAEMRNELISYIEDQAINGVYKTIPKEVKIQDLMTGAEKTVMRVEIAKDATGAPLRQEASPLTRFGVKIYNLSINSIDYDDNVEKQISAQQQAIMEVQTAMAEAKKAEQRALTAAKEGEANAAKAKWEQETIKAKAVTEAQQKLEVAELDRKAAEQIKQKEILLGEGEARRKELAMQAEGALEQKLKAYIEVNKLYADAISKYTGAWVPSIVMGGSGKSGSGAQDMIDLLMVKTAKDLNLDLSVPGNTKK